MAQAGGAMGSPTLAEPLLTPPQPLERLGDAVGPLHQEAPGAKLISVFVQTITFNLIASGYSPEARESSR